MTRLRLLALLLIIALPLLVAWFDMSVFAAVVLVLLALLAMNLAALKRMVTKPPGPALQLETIQQSHFAEKVRWCMDRLGVEYREQVVGGVIGAFFLGRSIPVLYVNAGRTQNALQESSEILRYLSGRYGAELGECAAFLEGTPERLAWERKLDRYGVDQQIWIYHHLLKDPALCKEAWGANSRQIPGWHRWAIKVLYPLLSMLISKAFNPDEDNYLKAKARTEMLLGETEALLSDGRSALLGGTTTDYIDITLASLSALWLQPEQFNARMLGDERIPSSLIPEKMQRDMASWKQQFPATTGHLERLYRDERFDSGSAQS